MSENAYAEWDGDDVYTLWAEGANRRLAELRPVLDAADELADAVVRFVHPKNVPDALASYRAAVLKAKGEAR